MNLTAKAITQLRPPAKRLDVKDDLTRGLYLRLYPSGAKSWRFCYRQGGRGGRLRVVTIGDWPTVGLADARARAAELTAQLRTGSNPAAEAQRAKVKAARMPTVEAFATRYLDEHARPNKKSWRLDEWLLARKVLPKIGKLKLDEVKRADVAALVQSVRNPHEGDAPVIANRTLAVVKRMFRFAVDAGVLENDPAVHVRPTREKPRERVLTDDELRTFWLATAPGHLHPSTRLALRLVALTGARAGEAAGIALEELDLDAARWTLPAARSKNGLEHVVPLSPAALAVVREALPLASEGFLFPARTLRLSGHKGDENRTRAVGPLTRDALTKAMEKVFALPTDAAPAAKPVLSRAEGSSKAGKVKADTSGQVARPTAPRPTPHDLRRTVATRLGALGFPPHVVERVLNHALVGMMKVYQRHDFDKEKRAALVAWAAELTRIVEGRELDGAKVVSIA